MVQPLRMGSEIPEPYQNCFKITWTTKAEKGGGDGDVGMFMNKTFFCLPLFSDKIEVNY